MGRTPSHLAHSRVPLPGISYSSSRITPKWRHMTMPPNHFSGGRVLPLPVAGLDKCHDQLLGLPDGVSDVASEPTSIKPNSGLSSVPLGLLAGALCAPQVQRFNCAGENDAAIDEGPVDMVVQAVRDQRDSYEHKKRQAEHLCRRMTLDEA